MVMDLATIEKTHDLLDAMISGQPVMVTADIKNGSGEVTKRGGWVTFITEIRRPSPEHGQLLYGHDDPVVCVRQPREDPGGGAITLMLSPHDIAIVSVE